MAKSTVSDWDTVSANNTDIAGVNIAEGCAAAGINDAIRAVMAQIKAWITAATFNTPNAGTTGGVRISGNATTGNAILQFVDSAGAAQWGYINITSAGVFSFTDSAGVPHNMGFRSLPTSRTVAVAAIIALADEGMIIKSSAGGLTVPNNSTVACPVDFSTAFYNASNSGQTVAVAGGVTLRLEGSATTVTTVVIPPRTRAFFWQVAANEWVVSGKGVA